MKSLLKKLVAKLLSKAICTECHEIVPRNEIYQGECNTCWPPMTVKYNLTGGKLF